MRLPLVLVWLETRRTNSYRTTKGCWPVVLVILAERWKEAAVEREGWSLEAWAQILQASVGLLDLPVSCQ